MSATLYSLYGNGTRTFRMATLWDLHTATDRYEVRAAGNSIRLYTNKVFHSQWSAQRPFAGGIWDCLSLPVLYHLPRMPLRVLLLGVGGGAVIKQLEHMGAFSELTGIDIDPIHLQVAHDWFDVDNTCVNLVAADAISWVKNYSDERFDVVIDDLFAGADGDPQRVQPLTEDWCNYLHGLLTDNGLCVANCISPRECTKAAGAFAACGFKQGYRWSLPHYENSVAVLFNEPIATRAFVDNLGSSSLSPALRRQAMTINRKALKLPGV